VIPQKTLIYTEAVIARFETSIFESTAAHKATMFQTRDNTKLNALTVNANISFDKSRKYKPLPFQKNYGYKDIQVHYGSHRCMVLLSEPL